jgi:hypothetical protein
MRKRSLSTSAKIAPASATRSSSGAMAGYCGASGRSRREIGPADDGVDVMPRRLEERRLRRPVADHSGAHALNADLFLITNFIANSR